jgi:hypothetical protein
LVETAQTVLRYSIVGTNDMIETAGGQIPYNNVGTVYTGSEKDDHLNKKVERVAGDPAYVSAYYQPTGQLGVPLVTLHNALDPAVPSEHELIYGSMATPGWFFPYPIPLAESYGHCNFTSDEVLGAFGMLVGVVGP